MTLTESLNRFKAATAPEDVFDGAVTAEDLKVQFREMAKVVHPDGKKGKVLKDAEEAFKLLKDWHEKAKAKMANGTYGNLLAISPVTVKTKKASYTLTRRMPGGDIANVYTGREDLHPSSSAFPSPFVLKVCRSPANNDLLENERDILSYLWTEAKTAKLKAMAHIVKFHDSFELAVGPARKRVNVCHLAHGYYNLVEVKAAYPDGLDLRDAAWMFNRLLGALLICQQAGVVHNAVLPEHVLIHPEKHNAKLCGWSYATRGKSKVSAIVAARKSMYAPEVFAKPTSTATDIYMATGTLFSIVNRSTIPRNVLGLLKTCLLAQRSRPGEVWALFKEFGEELEKAFGPKKFRVFTMPTASNAVV